MKSSTGSSIMTAGKAKQKNIKPKTMTKGVVKKGKVTVHKSSTLREKTSAPGIDKRMAFAILHELQKYKALRKSADSLENDLKDLYGNDTMSSEHEQHDLNHVVILQSKTSKPNEIPLPVLVPVPESIQNQASTLDEKSSSSTSDSNESSNLSTSGSEVNSKTNIEPLAPHDDASTASDESRDDDADDDDNHDDEDDNDEDNSEDQEMDATSTSDEESESENDSQSESDGSLIEFITKKANDDKHNSNCDSDESEDSSDSDEGDSSESEEDASAEDNNNNAATQNADANTPLVSPDDSDTDVSDVEVSDVSSVDVSSSSDDDNDDDDDDDDDDNDNKEAESSSEETSSSEDSESDDEEDLKHATKKRQDAAAKAKAAAAAAAAWTPKPMVPRVDINVTPGSDGAQALNAGKPFQRVDDQYWGEIAMKDGGAMADNSYEYVFGNEGFGAKDNAKLSQTRGKRFNHEKTKRKRSFNGFGRTGGKISMVSNSTKFNYD